MGTEKRRHARKRGLGFAVCPQMEGREEGRKEGRKEGREKKGWQDSTQGSGSLQGFARPNLVVYPVSVGLE